MTVQLDRETQLIVQTGAAALWRLEPHESYDGDSHGPSAGHDTCEMHSWTCIWCSMEPPICGSCRPVTPPCPANGGIHTCACRERAHGR